MPANAQLVEDGAPAALSAPEQSVSARGDLSLKLAGGVPMCYDDYRDGTLTLKLYDAALGFDVSALQNEFVAAAAAEPLDPEKDGGEGVKLTLEIAPGSHLWGYDVTYADGATTLYLKRPRRWAPSGQAAGGGDRAAGRGPRRQRHRRGGHRRRHRHGGKGRQPGPDPGPPATGCSSWARRC